MNDENKNELIDSNNSIKEEEDYNDNDLDIPPFIRDRQDY